MVLVIVGWTYQVKDASGRLWCWSSDDVFARYVYLDPDTRPRAVARTEVLGGGVQVDRDADGNAVGIEFV